LEHTRPLSASHRRRRGERCEENNVAKNKEIGRVDRKPGQQIMNCRYATRKTLQLAQAAAAPRCTAACDGACRASYETNTTSAASATDAASATSTAGAASATPAATASAPRDLHADAEVFLVEEMESGETDVGDFFVAERDHLARDIVRFLLNVACRYDRSRCTSR
jgi:hypothetical protein